MFNRSKGALEFWDGVLKTTHCHVQVLNLLLNCFNCEALVDINHKHLLSNWVGIDAENLFGCGEGIIVMRFESLVDGSFHRCDLVKGHWWEEQCCVISDERARVDVMRSHDSSDGVETNCFHCSKWRSLYS